MRLRIFPLKRHGKPKRANKTKILPLISKFSQCSKLIFGCSFLSTTKLQTIVWLFPERKSFKASHLLNFSSASVSPCPAMGASNSRSSSSKYSGYFSAYSSLSCSNVFPIKFPSLSACSFSSVRHVLKLFVKKNKYESVY